jgi:hypothetical protein
MGGFRVRIHYFGSQIRIRISVKSLIWIRIYINSEDKVSK